jgi:predicted dehydrogenase
VPALQKNDKTAIAAIYSRSKSSAEKLAADAGDGVDAYYDSPAESGKSLDDLLKRSEIDAVIVCLPITVQPDAVKKSMAAGKHVLSEKPIGKDVDVALDQIRYHEQNAPRSIWLVAENFRFLTALTYAQAQISDIGGEVVGFHVNVFAYLDENDKFYQTAW